MKFSTPIRHRHLNKPTKMNDSVIIIGASSGIGREIALIYASRGCKVLAAGRRAEPLQELADRFPSAVTTALLDVTAPDCADSLRSLLDSFVPSKVINCAGIGSTNPGLDLAVDRSTVMTNCLGFTTVADTVFNWMARRGESSVFAAISSIAGTRPLSPALSYSASKTYQAAYLAGLDQLRRVNRYPITITDIRPGYVATPLLNPSKRHPMLMQPDRAARLIVKAIDRRRRVAVVDWRWRLLTALWRLIPSWLWVRLPIKAGL